MTFPVSPADDSPADDDAIQRLVDGELSPADQRRLLESIERTGDWRRVALAFLEEQAFAGAARELVRPASPTVVAYAAPRRPFAPVLPRLASLAAALVIAFSGGWWLARSNVPETAFPIVQRETSEPSTSLKPDYAPSEPPSLPQVQFVFADGRGELSEVLHVPVIEADDAADLRRDPFRADPLSQQLEALLAAENKRVVPRDQWVEVDLSDGRRGVMPVRDWVVSDADER